MAGAIKMRFVDAKTGKTTVTTSPVEAAKALNRTYRKAVKRFGADAEKGIRLWLTGVKGDAQEITPVDKSVLVGSAFISTEVTAGGNVKARIGYTAKHAPFVHEMPSDSNWTKPGTGNKFLEKAVLRNAGSLLSMIKRFAKR